MKSIILKPTDQVVVSQRAADIPIIIDWREEMDLKIDNYIPTH